MGRVIKNLPTWFILSQCHDELEAVIFIFYCLTILVLLLAGF